MKVTITYIHLKSPFKFFALAQNAMQILQQLKGTSHKAFKKKGFWTRHYTMTLWESEEELKQFARSGAHLQAMKRSVKIAREIRILTINATELPDWETAVKMLEGAKPIRYNR